MPIDFSLAQPQTDVQTSNMSSTQYRAIELAIIPRAGKVPSLELLAAATLGAQCPVKSVERRMRADHIAILIDSALLDSGI